MRKRLLVAACVLMLAGGVGLAQDKSEESSTSSVQLATGTHYQLEFVMQQVEAGKVINSRRYVAEMSPVEAKGRPGSIRTGSKVPLCTGGCTSRSAQTQFTYVNVGFNIDFSNAQLEGDKMYLWLTVDLSSADATAANNPIQNPTIRNNSWSAGVTVPLGKPTVVFSSDDLTSKRTIQVELTVTPVK